MVMMKPIMPESIWRHTDYGVVVVILSLVTDHKTWEITMVDREKNVIVIEVQPNEWLRKATFVCCIDELDRSK